MKQGGRGGVKSITLATVICTDNRAGNVFEQRSEGGGNRQRSGRLGEMNLLACALCAGRLAISVVTSVNRYVTSFRGNEADLLTHNGSKLVDYEFMNGRIDNIFDELRDKRVFIATTKN
jgi:hypothetical protein